jgi:hypothetical protein
MLKRIPFVFLFLAAPAVAQQAHDVTLTGPEFMQVLNELAAHEPGILILMKRQAEAQQAAVKAAEVIAKETAAVPAPPPPASVPAPPPPAGADPTSTPAPVTP